MLPNEETPKRSAAQRRIPPPAAGQQPSPQLSTKPLPSLCLLFLLFPLPPRCPIITLLNRTAAGTFIFRLAPRRFYPHLAALV